MRRTAREIVHRDLKPDNIFVTKTGIKVLDFGLAKVLMKSKSEVKPHNETLPLTREGAILGTLQYMSPEQLQGHEADTRSDVFAFGAVLFEMLTGRRAFSGDNQASIITAIMSGDPPSLTELQPLAPPALDRTLRLCFAKDPELRWQSARDLSEELKWIAESGSAAATVVPMTGRSWRGLTFALFCAALVSLISVLSLAFFRNPETTKTFRLQMNTPKSNSAFPDIVPSVSPGGSHIAFIAADRNGVNHIWLRLISSFGERMLPGTENANDLCWSPDGTHLAFSGGRKLQTIGIQGGPPQLILDYGITGGVYSGLSWGSAGKILFSNRRYGSAGLGQIRFEGGPVSAATHLNASRGEFFHGSPQFLPDGKHFLFHALSRQHENNAIYVGSLDEPEPKRVMVNDLEAVFANGFLLYIRNGTLLAQQFDWKSARLGGEPVAFSDQVFALTSTIWSVSGFSVSRNVLAYWPRTPSTTQLTWLDRKGKRLGSIGEPGDYSNPALSPDGKRVAVGRRDPQTGMRDVWIFDQDGGAQRLTFDPKDDFNPLWSPDGTRIAFSSDRRGNRDIYLMAANGVGTEKPLVISDEAKSVEDWSHDGKLLLYNNTVFKIKAVQADGHAKPLIVMDGLGDYDQGRLSPDGKWIAYRVNETGRSNIYVQRFPPTGSKLQISIEGGSEPSWRGDGKELYFAKQNTLMAVDIKSTSSGLEHGTPRALFEAPFTWEVRRNRYVPSADGQRFLIVEEEPGSRTINVVLNWSTALKR
jgi:Tol biopolymer transport system component